ncbi:hypothetical protein M9H77_31425 [Catharanthus roseus]|uniref:Uncharacterized protein n=1 Tax=Catharanthus roseus TaxID=4058 RepID=A0ACC0A018_CATRO|nr:hypothetical protein M9H77_31425 [Catharanthus roseus]
MFFRTMTNCSYFWNDITQCRQRILLYVAILPYEGLFRWRGRFRLRRVDPLEEGRRPRRLGTVRAQQATEVLGQEFLDQISPEGHMFMVMFHCGAYKLVPRGTQMPYSASVDLVARLGVSHTRRG